MKTYWMFWWGRTDNPLRELNPLDWIGVILVVLFFSAGCLLADLPARVVICMVLSTLIWVYWVSQVKTMAAPINLLVPGFHQRLLKTSMAHWLIATLLFAFAATARDKLNNFFAISLLLGYGLLALTWLANLRSVWIAVPSGIGLIWGAWRVAEYLRFDDYSSLAIAILMVSWMVMPVLAWLAINNLWREGAARRLKKKNVPFRDVLHHWFLRKMMRACSNPEFNS